MYLELVPSEGQSQCQATCQETLPHIFLFFVTPVKPCYAGNPSDLFHGTGWFSAVSLNCKCIEQNNKVLKFKVQESTDST